MTDLEMTELCAKAMGITVYLTKRTVIATGKDDSFYRFPDGPAYDPLHDDTQAMALLKKFNLNALAPTEPPYQHWLVENKQGTKLAFSETLNRAIVECVAKMQSAKADSPA